MVSIQRSASYSVDDSVDVGSTREIFFGGLALEKHLLQLVNSNFALMIHFRWPIMSGGDTCAVFSAFRPLASTNSHISLTGRVRETRRTCLLF